MNNTEAIDAFCKANNVTTEIHTFAGWLKRGYKVKKGEKASFAFPLWSHSEKESTGKKTETFDIKQFKKAMQDLNELVLRHKSTEINIDEARNMESEADTEAGYILKIFKKVNSHYETPIITISQTELIKECASVVAREAEKAMSKKEQQLKEVLAELRK